MTCNANYFRSSVSNTCPCIDRYFDNNTAVCVRCHYSCKTCINNITCSSCDNSKFRSQSSPDSELCKCEFLPGYYDDKSN